MAGLWVRQPVCVKVFGLAAALTVLLIVFCADQPRLQLMSILSGGRRFTCNMHTSPSLRVGSLTPKAHPFCTTGESKLVTLVTAALRSTASDVAPLPEVWTAYMSRQVMVHLQEFAAPENAEKRLVREAGDIQLPASNVLAAFVRVYVLTQPGRTRQQTLAHHTLRALGLSYTMCYTIPPPPAALEALASQNATTVSHLRRLLDDSTAAANVSRNATAAAQAYRALQALDRLREAASHWWLLNRIAGGATRRGEEAINGVGHGHGDHSSTPPRRQVLQASFLVLTDTAVVHPSAFSAAFALLPETSSQPTDGQGIDQVRSADMLLLGRPGPDLKAWETADGSPLAAYAVSSRAACRLADAIARLLRHAVAAAVDSDPVLAAVAAVSRSGSGRDGTLAAPLAVVSWPLVEVAAILKPIAYTSATPVEDAALVRSWYEHGWPANMLPPGLLRDLGLPKLPSEHRAYHYDGEPACRSPLGSGRQSNDALTNSAEADDNANSATRGSGWAAARRDLAICIAFFSPARAKRPLALLQQSVATYASQGAPVFIMELVYDDEVPQLQSLAGATVFHVRSHSVMFHKENLWNLLSSRVPPQYTKLLFLDANLIFFEPYWYEAVSRALDDHSIVQPFQTVMHTTADRTAVIRYQPGLVAALATGGVPRENLGSGSHWPASGFGIALQRSWLAEVGGFMDMAVMGGGDMLLCAAVLALNVSRLRVLKYQPYAHAAQGAFMQNVAAAAMRRRTDERAVPRRDATDSYSSASNDLAAHAEAHKSSLTDMCGGVTRDFAAASQVHTFEWFPGASIAWDKARFPVRRSSGTSASEFTADIAWVSLTAEHLFHGSLSKRQYSSRYELSQELRAEDLWRNADGVIEFVDAERWNPVTRTYFAARGEDD